MPRGVGVDLNGSGAALSSVSFSTVAPRDMTRSCADAEHDDLVEDVHAIIVAERRLGQTGERWPRRGVLPWSHAGTWRPAELSGRPVA
jgi:hypothetical protein